MKRLLTAALFALIPTNAAANSGSASSAMNDLMRIFPLPGRGSVVEARSAEPPRGTSLYRIRRGMEGTFRGEFRCRRDARCQAESCAWRNHRRRLRHRKQTARPRFDDTVRGASHAAVSVSQMLIYSPSPQGADQTERKQDGGINADATRPV